jgi:hypothetical protein
MALPDPRRSRLPAGSALELERQEAVASRGSDKPYRYAHPNGRLSVCGLAAEGDMTMRIEQSTVPASGVAGGRIGHV